MSKGALSAYSIPYGHFSAQYMELFSSPLGILIKSLAAMAEEASRGASRSTLPILQCFLGITDMTEGSNYSILIHCPGETCYGPVKCSTATPKTLN